MPSNQQPRLPPPMECDPLFVSPEVLRQNRDKIVEYANGLVVESYQRHAQFNIWSRCQMNIELALYHKVLNRAGGKVRAPKIQNACVSNAAIQTAKPFKVNIRQRSTGEPPTWYFNAAAAPLELQNKFDPEAPLSPDEVAALQTVIQMDQQQAAQTGQPPATNPEMLVRVDDSTLRGALSEVVEAKLDASNALAMVRENVWYNNIFGYQMMGVKWNAVERRPMFINREPPTVHFDTTRTDVSEMAFYIEDDFYGEDEALQMFQSPEVQESIRKNAQTGLPRLAGQMPYALPAYWMQKFFYREVIIMRSLWVRHQPYPLTAEEAVSSGRVIKGMPNAGVDPANPIQTDGMDNPVGVGVGAPVDGSGAVEPVYYAVNEDGSPDPTPVVFPDSRFVRYSIREIVIVADKVVSDGECRRINIPVGHNVNIPIPWTPFGQGEPERLQALSDAYNNTLTDIVTNGEFAATPAQITSQEVVKANPRLANNAYTQPGALYVVPGSAWLTYGADKGNPLIQTLDAPPTPPDSWRREEMLDRVIRDASDQSDVLRGQAPSSDASGVQVEALQEAGKGSINFKSQRTETMLAYVTKVIIGDILTNMTPDELSQDFPKYSVYIWKELHRRLVQHYLFCELSVEIASGGQAARRQRGVDLINARSQGISVSEPEIMECFDLDPEEQLQRQAEFDRQKAVAMQLMPQQQGEDGGQGGPQNGKMKSEKPAPRQRVAGGNPR